MFKKWARVAAVITLIFLPLVIGLIYRNSAHTIYRKLIDYPEKITIATGPKSGLYRSLSENLAETIRTELNLDVMPNVSTEGSLDNLLCLRKGETDFALYQPGTYEILQKHAPELLKNMIGFGQTSEIRFVANLYSQPAHFIVRRGAGIDSPADLRGKKVQLGSKNSGDYAMSLILLSHFGLDENSIDARYLDDYSKVKKNFLDDALDAAFITIGVEAPIFPELFNTGVCELRSIAYAEAMITKHIFLSPYKIPAGLYQRQPRVEPAHDIATVSLGAQLLTTTGVHDGLVKEVTRLVMREDFLKRNQLGELYLKGQKYAQKKPEFTMHPGARSFYEPEFDIHIFESYDAIYSLVASVLIAAFLLVRMLRQRQARNKEHKLDRHMRSLLDIERRQVNLDTNSNTNDIETLQKLLDEVTFLRQGALHELAAHELNEDRATDSLVQMCHALSNKINAKILRQRLDQQFSKLAEVLAVAGKTAHGSDKEK